MSPGSCLRPSRRIAVGAGLVLLLLSVSACQLADSQPIAILASSVVSGAAPLMIEFDLSYSTQPDGQPLTYELDFGDGSPLETGTEFGIIISHEYEQSGVYEANLQVIDTAGRADVDSLTITVDENGPAVGTDVGDSAPDFTAAITDGGQFTLSDARGQIVLLDFWGVWCTPCRKSLPHLDALVTEYTADGVVAVLVSTDPVEQDAVDYLAQRDYTQFVSIWEPGGKSTRIAALYGVLNGGPVGIPRTFVLDRQGVIRWVGHPLDLSSETIESLLLPPARGPRATVEASR